MKLSALICFTIFLSFIVFSTQLEKAQSLSENQNLFNLWNEVPGAGGSKPKKANSKDAAKRPQRKILKRSDSRDPAAYSVKSLYDTGFSQVQAQGWMSVSSPSFKDEADFPVFQHPDGNSEIVTSLDYTRINEAFKEPPSDKSVKDVKPDKNSPPGKSFFWFKLNSRFIYFYESPKCLNLLGQVNYYEKVEPSSANFIDPLCFNLIEKEGNTWKFCGKIHEDAKKFLCRIQKNLHRKSLDDYCLGKKPPTKFVDESTPPPPPKPGALVEKIITQPYILIPLPREMCNENWNYANNGKDWKCLCKEGNKFIIMY